MSLEKLVLEDTFLEWCNKTNSTIDVVNNQLSNDMLNLLTTVSKTTLVSALNELNEKKLDKDGGIIKDSLQINGELDVKNNIRIGSDLTGDSIIKLYDANKLKYKNFGWSAEQKALSVEDDDGNFNKILTANSTIDLEKENVDMLSRRTTSNILVNTIGEEGQIYYSQDEKHLYVFDGEKKGGYKIPFREDIGETEMFKVSSIDTQPGYLLDKIETDSGIRIITIGSDVQKIRLQSNTIPGEVKLYAGTESSIPFGWVKCDGRLLNREKYADLFSRIGTIYGAGDGITTFNVPNMEGRVPLGQSKEYGLGTMGGEKEHALTVQEIPEHKHIAPFSEAYGNDPWGLVSKGHYGSNGGRDFDNWWAYTSPVGGNQPHNNMQPYIAMFYIIFTGIY